MANSNSAKKRIRQNATARERNRARRTRVKGLIRSFLDAVHEKDAARAADAYRVVTKVLDQTAAKGTIHKRTAARRKSRLAARFNAMATAGK